MTDTKNIDISYRRPRSSSRDSRYLWAVFIAVMGITGVTSFWAALIIEARISRDIENLNETDARFISSTLSVDGRYVNVEAVVGTNSEKKQLLDKIRTAIKSMPSASSAVTGIGEDKILIDPSLVDLAIPRVASGSNKSSNSEQNRVLADETAPESKDLNQSAQFNLESQNTPQLDRQISEIQRTDACALSVFRIPAGAGISFETDSAELAQSAETYLVQVAETLSECGRVRVSITGHTDNVGRAERNLQLSRARALAVEAYLNKLGTGEAELIAEGFGDSRPITSNDSIAGRARNRRIDIEILPALEAVKEQIDSPANTQ